VYSKDYLISELRPSSGIPVLRKLDPFPYAGEKMETYLPIWLDWKEPFSIAGLALYIGPN
jgi:hypothetical protein